MPHFWCFWREGQLETHKSLASLGDTSLLGHGVHLLYHCLPLHLARSRLDPESHHVLPVALLSCRVTDLEPQLH